MKPGGPSLSVTIVAQDEERTVGDVLSSVAGLADEVVFLDSGSTDRTIEIAQQFGVRFHHQDWLGYSAQKNLAIDMAQGEWILSLDADEVVTPALGDEIRSVLATSVPESIGGFRLPRVLYIGNTPVKRGGFYPDAQLRLIRKGRGRFRPRIVHESIGVEGKVVQLKNDLLHYAYTDLEQYAATMDKYARLSAEHYLSQGPTFWRTNPVNQWLHPAWTLFQRQVIRGGIFGGPLCRELNLIYAGYVRKKIVYLRELVEQQKGLAQGE